MSSSPGYFSGPPVVAFVPSDQHEWTSYASCADEAPEAMFPMPANTTGLAYAKAVCSDCTVRSQCLEAALSRNEPEGVWGGLDTDERHALKRKRQNRVIRDRQRVERAEAKQRDADARLADTAGLTVEDAEGRAVRVKPLKQRADNGTSPVFTRPSIG